MPLMQAPLHRDWIEAHIPHHGRMCLLDEVLAFDATTLRSRSASHRQPDHPLAGANGLGIACAVEYAAQAMAVHGALCALGADAPQARAAAGFLAALRSVHIHVLRLDDIDADLICEVAQRAGDASSAVYEFKVSAQQRPLLNGRATVVFDAGARMSA